ncbi:hypothetical protein RUM43_003764 [Polyplax serrata]|uniref:Uncharacterized protein n=1 Tax=Polyplax serrata TaxID=468196 RepID=A0AAN8Q1P7_POLSC
MTKALCSPALKKKTRKDAMRDELLGHKGHELNGQVKMKGLLVVRFPSYAGHGRGAPRHCVHLTPKALSRHPRNAQIELENSFTMRVYASL